MSLLLVQQRNGGRVRRVRKRRRPVQAEHKTPPPSARLLRAPPPPAVRTFGRCYDLCTQSVKTDHGCVCTGRLNPVSKQKWWCHARCPRHAVSLVQRDWLSRPWDTVTSTSERAASRTRQRAYCLKSARVNGDELHAFAPCKENVDRAKTESRTVQFILSIATLKLLSALRLKAQSTDAETLHSLQLFLRSFTQTQVQLDRLTLERAQQLTRQLSSQIRDRSAGEVYRYFLTELRDGLQSQREPTPILDWIVDHIPPDDLGDFLRGAQLQFDDDGQLYRRLKAQEKAYPRFSSHHPSVKNIQHIAVNEILFDQFFHILGGITPDGASWIQTESSRWSPGLTVADVFYSVLQEPSYLKDMAEHSLDFIVHKLTHRNIGPLGSTARGEWDPIRIWNGLPDSRRSQLLSPPSQLPVVITQSPTPSPSLPVLPPGVPSSIALPLIAPPT